MLEAQHAEICHLSDLLNRERSTSSPISAITVSSLSISSQSVSNRSIPSAKIEEGSEEIERSNNKRRKM
jgi:hypothetical protein